ncbi:acetyltransferase [Pseudomonas sp. SCB32]|uniref:acetyltransferase n=1 Tax=Pseudomonas sp. SCB32 TaxID=2653853 RepID=UPI0012643DE5|nr:acetyltransferase [Pseudomonas sp. SCB32]
MGLSVSVIDTTSELFAAVRQLRARYLGENPAQEDDYERREGLRDALSYHLIYLDDNRVVGTLRVTPLGHGFSFVERAVDVHAHFPMPTDAFDANRLVLDECYRGGRHLRMFLLQAAIWLKANTHLRFISALCRGQLAALYIGLGGRMLIEEVIWAPQQVERRYSLVYLELEQVYNTVKGGN